MSWNNVCVEGFCFGECEGGEYPCGQTYPTAFCLSNHICPHFYFAETSERETAIFVPLRLILWDRILIARDNIGWQLRWWFWDRLWFNQRKIEEFFNNIPVASAEESEAVANFEAEDKRDRIEFAKWFDKAIKENM